MLSPPSREIDRDAQITHDAVRDVVEPLLRVGIAAARTELHQIDDRREEPARAASAPRASSSSFPDPARAITQQDSRARVASLSA